jgi:predicted ATP-dependent endonuclease of OLD family
MRIRNVKIRNFRALLELSIDFSNMTVIIGENDCGKTSVMLALAAFFDAKKLTDPADYFKKDTYTPVLIEVTFHEFGDKFDDYGMTGYETVVVRRTFEFNEKPLTEIQVGGNWQGVRSKFDDILPDFVLVPAGRNLDSEGKMTTTSLFGQLFLPLIRNVVDGEGAQAASDLREKIRFGVAKRVTDLQDALREQLNNSELKLKHDIEVDPLKGINIPIEMSDERVQGIPMENRGAGIQNSFILALFRIYAKYETQDFVFAIEEPENNLHPRAQREMRWAMEDFSRKSQVICTTHSPVFLDLGRLEDNIVLRRRNDGATEISRFGLEDPNELRELVGIKVSDALLSGGGNCTLIVEGDTELYAYPHLFRCIGINPRSLGISIISVGGPNVKNMLMHARILKAYNLPCIIVVDKNKLVEAQKVEAAKISNVKMVHVLEKGNFEEYLPLELLVEVLNDLCGGDKISKFDVDSENPVENQLKKLVHEKYPGSRFEHLKVHLGQEVGRRMVERGLKPDDEITAILEKAKEIAMV